VPENNPPAEHASPMKSSLAARLAARIERELRAAEAGIEAATQRARCVRLVGPITRSATGGRP
jgi:hypothetical protein